MQHKSSDADALPGESSEQAPLRVLIVDDDDVFFYLFQRLISRLTVPVSISRAADGNEALRVFRENKADNHFFDLAFIDLNMPIMGGIELMEDLSKDEEIVSATDFYVISSSAYPPELERAQAMPIVKGMFGKPLENQKIKAVLEACYQSQLLK